MFSHTKVISEELLFSKTTMSPTSNFFISASGNTVVPRIKSTSTGLKAKSASVNLGVFDVFSSGFRISFGTEIINLAALSETSLLTKYVKCRISL